MTIHDQHAEAPPAGQDPEPRPEYDFIASDAGRMLEQAITAGTPPRGTDGIDPAGHRRTVLAFVARAWERQPGMPLGALIKRAADDVAGHGAEPALLDDLALVLGLGRVAKGAGEPF